ncbi:MAG: PTS system mannose/fructose/sorbose family transporter subunit IID [Erysipelotrichaceae bacterium]
MTTNVEVKTNEKKLTRADLIKCFLIWEATSESCLSYERLMSLGFCHSMVPIINRLYSTKEDRVEALRRHMTFFNTENNWGAFIPGIVCSMEEDLANGGSVDSEAISNVKLGLMGPLAGIGDTITQGLLKTVLLAICVDMTLSGNVAGPVIYAIAFGIYLISMGMITFSQGYKLGQNVLAKITNPMIMKKITNCLSILGLTIAGAMIINNVNITTPLTIVAGNSKVVIQDLLNSILPGMLSIIFVVSSFLYLKKNGNVFRLMIILFVVAAACSLLGIL